MTIIVVKYTQLRTTAHVGNSYCNDNYVKYFIIACVEPYPPLYGIVSSDGHRFFEDSADYACDEGYVLNGDPHHTCLSNGLWSSLPPVCVPVGKLHIDCI